MVWWTRAVLGLTSFFMLLAVLWLLLPIPANTIETIYSRGIFPALAWLVVGITDFVPFSLAGLAVLVLPIACGFWMTRAIRAKHWAWFWRVPVVGFALYGVFTLLWGANYRRQPIEELLKLQTTLVKTQDLEMLAENLLVVLQQEADVPRDQARAFASLRQAIGQQIKTINGFTPSLPTKIKATPAGLLLVIQTSGVISPLTLEAHADSALPEPFFLAVSAHELVHTSGFAGEADTDLITALAGLRSSDGYARYCIALTYFARILGDSSQTAQNGLIKALPAQAKADYAALRQAQKQHQNPFLSQISQATYNQYLKSQGVEAGVQDYSRIGRLLAAAQNKGLIFR